jgi:hypothetical protein
MDDQELGFADNNVLGVGHLLVGQITYGYVIHTTVHSAP